MNSNNVKTANIFEKKDILKSSKAFLLPSMRRIKNMQGADIERL